MCINLINYLAMCCQYTNHDGTINDNSSLDEPELFVNTTLIDLQLSFNSYPFIFFYFQIRRKSKAFNAKLQEGDEVISVNGHNVRNVGRDVAMGYVDATVDTLDLEIVRYGIASNGHYGGDKNHTIIIIIHFIFTFQSSLLTKRN